MPTTTPKPVSIGTSKLRELQTKPSRPCFAAHAVNLGGLRTGRWADGMHFA
jgi:hypothetical protein